MLVTKSDFIKYLASAMPAGITQAAYVESAMYLSSQNLVFGDDAQIIGFDTYSENRIGQVPAPMLSKTESVLAYKYYQVIHGIDDSSSEIESPQNMLGVYLSPAAFLCSRVSHQF